MLPRESVPFLIVPLAYTAAVTVPLAVTDVRTLRLPNALVVPGLVLLAWALVWAALAAPARAVGGIAGSAAGGVLAVGWMLGAVGMGDVKLGVWLGGMAGLIGVPGRPGAAAQGLFLGAVVTAALLVAEISRRTGEEGLRVPCGPALLVAFWGAAASCLG